MESKLERVIEELVKGRGIATQLQNLLLIDDQEKGLDSGCLSMEQLAMQIYTSFSDSLSVLNSSTGQIHAGSTSSSHLNSQDSGDVVSRSPAKHRRGFYKRKKTGDSRMIVSSSIVDNFSWRKYGQKEVLNSKHPKCYFRCTHKHDQGCQALKQVQQTEHDPGMFNITYINHHTCNRSAKRKAPQTVSESTSVSVQGLEPTTIIDLSSAEYKDETSHANHRQSYDHITMSSCQEDAVALEVHNKPLTFYLPPGILGSDDNTDDFSNEYLCESGSLYGVDMEMSFPESVYFANDFHFDDNDLWGSST